MAKKYDLTAMEIFEYLNQFDCEDFDEQCTGFSEEDIADVEKKYNIKFPKTYRDYMKYCGNHPINDTHDHICQPDEILSTYDYLEEDIDEYEEDLEGLTKEEIENLCKESKIYKFCQLPKDKWHTIAPEYILTWYENQGVWHAGYLKSDLEKGIENPPMYVSTNEDYIEFEKAANNTDKFLQIIFFYVLFYLEDYMVEHIEDEEGVIEFLEENGLKFSKDGKIDMCLDTETNILYAWMVGENYAELITIDPEGCDFEDDEDEDEDE